MASCSQAQRRLKSHFVGDGDPSGGQGVHNHEVDADDVDVERRDA
jgi:hypothetical protein